MSKRTGRVSWMAAGLGVLLLTGLRTLGTEPTTVAPQPLAVSLATAVALNVPPCDSYPFQQQLSRSTGLDTLKEVLPLTAPHLHHNEAHDCQRLILFNAPGKPGLSYGPLVALLVAKHEIEVRDSHFSEGRVVAEIVNFDNLSYAPLGIEPGISCLWIKGKGNNDAAWSARIFQPPSGVCGPELQSLSPAAIGNLPGKDLTVRRRTYPAAPASPPNYPITGRWMWDADRREQFFGHTCGPAWCELGPSGFTPSPDFTQATVPGWGDEQLLAVPRGDGTLRVSALYGRIHPAPGLVDLRDNHFRQKLGAHVATLTFTGKDHAARLVYADKYQSRCSCLPHALQVFMRSELPRGTAEPKHWFSTDRDDWIEVDQNSRFEHAGKGAVRWAWNDRMDEGIWVACEDGCCRTDCPPGGC